MAMQWLLWLACTHAAAGIRTAKQAAVLWPQFGEGGRRCEDEQQAYRNMTRAKCENKPVAEGKPYYSYKSNKEMEKTKCIVSSTCELVGEIRGWRIFKELHHAARAELGMEAHVVIDTGRNGVPDARSHCANWCNIRGAGAGHASTSKTEAPAMVDAYFYLKTPGESDGCTDTLPDGSACPRFDRGCDSVDAIGFDAAEPRAPEAGAWFDYQVKQLAEFANFGDDAADSDSSAPTTKPVRPSSPPAASPPLSRRRRPTPPVVQPPPPQQQPEPAAPAAEATCCWGGGCGATGGSCAPSGSWCAMSEENCTGNCGGTWCPAGKQQGEPRPRQRQGRLRRGLQADSILLQQASQVKRNAKTEIRKQLSEEEL